MPATAVAPPPSPKPASSPSPPNAGGSPPSTPGVLPVVDTEKPMESYLGTIGDELGELDAADETAKKSPERPRDPVTKKFVKQPEEAPKKPQEKPEEAEALETPEEPEKPVEAEKPSNIRALGKAYDELKKERDTVYKPKLQSLEAKTKEYEAKIEQLSKSQPDLKPLQDKMAALEKEKQQLLEVVRFADYRKSPEFTDKYEKPYNEAWAKAVSEVTQLSMEMEDGTVRKATPNDLLALANAPLDQLDDLAGKWFPRSSARVIRHVEKIRDLAEAQDKALEEAKKGAGEFQNKQSEAQKKAAETFSQAYTGATTELTTKYPKWFAPDETDPKGNEVLKKGFEFADTVFSPNSQLTAEQKAGRLAVIRAKAANHDRLAARDKAKAARIAELEAKLAEYENSEPPTEGEAAPTTKTGGDWQSDVEAELRKLDR